MNQLFMDLFDITPTVGKYIDREKHNGTTTIVNNQREFIPCNVDSYKDYLEDIRKNGIKVALKIHPDGRIGDGNLRYWCLRKLWVTTRDAKWRRVPIDLWYLIGCGLGLKDVFSFRESLMPKIPRSIYENHTAYEPLKKLPKFTQDKLPNHSTMDIFIPSLRGFFYGTECPTCGEIISTTSVSNAVPLREEKKT